MTAQLLPFTWALGPAGLPAVLGWGPPPRPARGGTLLRHRLLFRFLQKNETFLNEHK